MKYQVWRNFAAMLDKKPLGEPGWLEVEQGGLMDGALFARAVIEFFTEDPESQGMIDAMATADGPHYQMLLDRVPETAEDRVRVTMAAVEDARAHIGMSVEHVVVAWKASKPRPVMKVRMLGLIQWPPIKDEVR